MIPKSLISIGLGFDFKVTIFLANFLSHYLHHLPMLKSLDKVHLVSLQYCQEFRISICLLKLVFILPQKASTTLH